MFTYYSLANGFLTGKYRSKDDLGKSPRGLRSVEYLEGKGPRVLAALDAVAAETGASLATIALAWTKAQPGITAPIASATSLEQFKDLAAALTLDLTPGADRRCSTARASKRPCRRERATSSITSVSDSKCGAGKTIRHWRSARSARPSRRALRSGSLP